MKIRMNFVSNSSSSSFIICSERFGNYSESEINEFFEENIDDCGVFNFNKNDIYHEYGWTYFKVQSIGEKIYYIISSHQFDRKIIKIIEDVIDELSQTADININKFIWDINNFDEGAVDHESYDILYQIKNDESEIKNFIMNKNSVIMNGNDNYDEIDESSYTVIWNFKNM